MNERPNSSGLDLRDSQQEPNLETLKRNVEELKSKLIALVTSEDRLRSKATPSPSNLGPSRERIQQPSDEVTHSNPYSRVMALKRMGIVQNYDSIREKSVAIIGVGGVGAVSAEMLTRCGIGKLILFDYDHVELANMNRLFFRPNQTGLPKSEAAKQTLLEINPDVDFEVYNYDVTLEENFEHLLDRLKHGGVDSKSPVDLLLCCVDNYSARMAINKACTDLNQTWMECGVSEDAMSGHVQLMLPGRTACFACVPPLAIVDGIDESSIKRDGVCAASLPTTMGIIAGMLVQNSLKYLLHFGELSFLQSYNSMKNYCPSSIILANKECSLQSCQDRQQECQTWTVENFLIELSSKSFGNEVESEAVHHTDNAWGIEQIQSGNEVEEQHQEGYYFDHGQYTDQFYGYDGQIQYDDVGQYSEPQNPSVPWHEQNSFVEGESAEKNLADELRGEFEIMQPLQPLQDQSDKFVPEGLSTEEVDSNSKFPDDEDSSSPDLSSPNSARGNGVVGVIDGGSSSDDEEDDENLR